LHPLGFTIEIVPTIRTFEVDHVEVLVTDVKFDDFLAGRAHPSPEGWRFVMRRLEEHPE
jgi:hypothetical protein